MNVHSWVLLLAATFHITALPGFSHLHPPPLTAPWNSWPAASLDRMQAGGRGDANLPSLPHVFIPIAFTQGWMKYQNLPSVEAKWRESQQNKGRMLNTAFYGPVSIVQARAQKNLNHSPKRALSRHAPAPTLAHLPSRTTQERVLLHACIAQPFTNFL